MTAAQRVDAQRPWAATVGYCRAIRRGAIVEVSGTSATSADGEVIAPGDVYAQTAHVLTEMVAAMAELGAAPADVVRTRVFLTNIGEWQAAGRAHGEVFGDCPPACTFVEVSGLMLPGHVVEVELSAIVDEPVDAR